MIIQFNSWDERRGLLSVKYRGRSPDLTLCDYNTWGLLKLQNVFGEISKFRTFETVHRGKYCSGHFNNTKIMLNMCN